MSTAEFLSPFPQHLSDANETREFVDHKTLEGEGQLVPDSRKIIAAFSNEEVEFFTGEYITTAGETIKVFIKEFALIPDSDFIDDHSKIVADETNYTLQLSRDSRVSNSTVEVVEVRYVDNKMQLIMRKYEGQTLDEQLQQKSPTYIQFLNISQKIGEVIIALHVNYGKFHRDIKTKNILLEGENYLHPRLCDYGLVSDLIKNNVGTPVFVDPQTLSEGSNEKPHYYRDIYGFATTLYVLLTRKKQFPYGFQHWLLNQRLSASAVDKVENLASYMLPGRDLIHDKKDLKDDVIKACVADYATADKEYLLLRAEDFPELDPELLVRFPELNSVFAKVFSPNGRSNFTSFAHFHQEVMRALTTETHKPKKEIRFRQLLLSLLSTYLLSYDVSA